MRSIGSTKAKDAVSMSKQRLHSVDTTSPLLPCTTKQRTVVTCASCLERQVRTNRAAALADRCPTCCTCPSLCSLCILLLITDHDNDFSVLLVLRRNPSSAAYTSPLLTCNLEYANHFWIFEKLLYTSIA